ncbi:MAG: efflux RND transporter periplasmic adaptor subunit [Planctomycetaceae bacterium]
MQRLLAVLLGHLLLAACGQRESAEEAPGGKREEFRAPVRVEFPSRATVEDTIHTTATLETERRVELFAEVEGILLERRADLGTLLTAAGNGVDPLLLARLDDRDLALAEAEATIAQEEKRGRVEELQLERAKAEQEMAQARSALEEAEAAFARADTARKDGDVTAAEWDAARFAHAIASSKLKGADASFRKADVALRLGDVAVRQAGVALARAVRNREKAFLRAPFPGVVTACSAREGQRVKAGDHLYTVEDPASLVVIAQIPVRDAARVTKGASVVVESTAVPGIATAGTVTLVAPAVNRDAGTVPVKIAVAPARGFLPGLYVALRVVVARREEALVVPKRAILRGDGEATSLFVVEEGKARRAAIRTGLEGPGVQEVLEGIGEDARVVVEGQDTLADGAKVEIRES